MSDGTKEFVSGLVGTVPTSGNLNLALPLQTGANFEEKIEKKIQEFNKQISEYNYLVDQKEYVLARGKFEEDLVPLYHAISFLRSSKLT